MTTTYKKPYLTTTLEDAVTNFYKRLGIYTPEHICERYISQKLHIYLEFKPKPSYHQVIGNYRKIIISDYKSPEEQRVIYFHELCHILRHAGNQLFMPKAFRELQEWDASNFTRYATIPYHMLKYIDFQSDNVISHAAELFSVPEYIAKDRLEQIKRKMGIIT